MPTMQEKTRETVRDANQTVQVLFTIGEGSEARKETVAAKVGEWFTPPVGWRLAQVEVKSVTQKMYYLWPEVRKGIASNDRPHNPVEAGGESRQESPQAGKLAFSVRPLPREEEESRESTCPRPSNRGHKGVK